MVPPLWGYGCHPPEPNDGKPLGSREPTQDTHNSLRYHNLKPFTVLLVLTLNKMWSTLLGLYVTFSVCEGWEWKVISKVYGNNFMQSCQCFIPLHTLYNRELTMVPALGTMVPTLGTMVPHIGDYGPRIGDCRPKLRFSGPQQVVESTHMTMGLDSKLYIILETLSSDPKESVSSVNLNKKKTNFYSQTPKSQCHPDPDWVVPTPLCVEASINLPCRGCLIFNNTQGKQVCTECECMWGHGTSALRPSLSAVAPTRDVANPWCAIVR